MPNFAPRLETVDTATAPETTLRAIARHAETLRAERLPEDPPLNEAALLADLRRRDTEADTRRFVLWDGETIVASAAVRLPLADNTHLASLDLGVQAPTAGAALPRACWPKSPRVPGKTIAACRPARPCCATWARRWSWNSSLFSSL